MCKILQHQDKVEKKLTLDLRCGTMLKILLRANLEIRLRVSCEPAVRVFLWAVRAFPHRCKWPFLFLIVDWIMINVAPGK